MLLNLVKKHKVESVLLLSLFVLTVFLRFTQLGYSNFYGDETKVFYLDKTVTASKFFLDQRKGPVQFFVAWSVEKVTGSYDEFYTRFPFALAGTISVFVLYFLVRKLFNYRSAFVASLLFSMNGFSVAFSRTVQYQSFLLLFGFLAILFMIYYLDNTPKGVYLLLSSVFLSLAFLSHYDAVFFAIPVVFMLLKFCKTLNMNLKNLVLFFVAPLVFILGAFYIPYINQGYLVTNTFDYIGRRVVGSNFLPNMSPYTIFVYNPLILGSIPLLFAFLAFFKTMTWKKNMIMLWFLMPFIAFQFAVLNPGTHIYNYLVPLFILAGVEIIEVFDSIGNWFLRRGFLYSIAFLLILSFFSTASIYVPFLSTDYPWKSVSFSFFKFPKANKERHLFLYGFPYNRGWDQIRDYLYKQEGVRSVYTNDNATMAEFYLKKYDITPPGSNYIPQYYVYFFDSQEFRYPDTPFLLSYEQEKEFFL